MKKNYDWLLVGMALFSMFFGAGNLIFPPSVGLSMGENWLLSAFGFALTGIGLPVLGVYLLVGDDIGSKAYNLHRNLDADCVSLIESVAVKPKG